MNQTERLRDIMSSLDITCMTQATSLQERLTLATEAKADIMEAHEILDNMIEDINDLTFLQYYSNSDSYHDLQRISELASLPSLSIDEIVDLLAQVRMHVQQPTGINHLN